MPPTVLKVSTSAVDSTIDLSVLFKQVDEFSKVVNVHHLQSVEPRKILVIWEGEIEELMADNVNSNDLMESRESSQMSSPHSRSGADSDQDIDATESSEIIGVLRDPEIQTTLKEIIDRRDKRRRCEGETHSRTNQCF